MPKRRRISYLVVVGSVSVLTLAGGSILPRTSSRAHTDATRLPQPKAHAILEKPGQADSARINQAYGKLPLSFEENQGQAPRSVRFISRGAGHSLFLTSNEAIMVMGQRQQKEQKGQDTTVVPNRPAPHRGRAMTVAVRMRLKGANPKPEILAENPLKGTTNYLIGKDPANWHSGIPTFGRVVCGEVYPGIDLTYYGNNRQFEYDFAVAPHADPRSIRISFGGIIKMRVDENGDLVLQTKAGEIRQLRPSIYEQNGDIKHFIDGRYAIRGRFEVGFDVESYDPGKKLIIDPIFNYSTLLGGTNSEIGKGIAIDASGNAYVAGITNSFNFPTVVSSYSTTYVNADDVFVTKFDPTGSSLVYSTFIGGTGYDDASTIAVDSGGNAYVAGTTNSTNYPTTPGVYLASQPGSGQFGFITKLSPNGSSLVYSTYLGTGYSTRINGIAVDTSGIAYLTGSTQSSSFPTTVGAFMTTPAGQNGQAFFTKLSADATSLLYSTFLGGVKLNSGNGIAIDQFGSSYITGNTQATDFPTTAGAFQTTFGGGAGSDGFVSKFDAAGSLVYSTYVGGKGDDTALGIAVDSSGDAFITGSTGSTNFPTTPGVSRESNGGAFKTTNSGSTWAPIDTGLTDLNIQTMVIDPEATTTLYAGTRTGGVFKSTDSGGNWAASDSGLTDMNIQAIAVDPTNSNVLYLGTSSRGVFKSTDAGGSWRGMNTGEGGSSVTQLAVDPVAPMTVYAATSGGTFRTTDGGANWTQVGNGLFFNSQGVAIDPGNHLTIYVAAFNIFKSTDGGVTWAKTGQIGSSVQALAIDQASAVYLATNAGIQKSTDGGLTFQIFDTGLTDIRVSTLALGSSAIYAAAPGGLFKSTNGGANWTAANTGIVGAVVTALAVDPTTPSNVYSGTASGNTDCFVTELNATGTALIYSTLLGGNGVDTGTSIALDNNDNAYVTGSTQSSNFPTTQAAVPASIFVFGTVGFVTKLNSTGAALIYSTLLDSSGSTQSSGIAVDSSFSAYVTGVTNDSNFPTTPGSFQPKLDQFSTDAFVCKLQPSPGLSADVQVTESNNVTGAITGGITYTITITNNGPDPAFGLLLIDNLPPGLNVSTCFSPTLGCQNSGNSVIGTANMIPSGGSATLTIFAFLNCATAVDGSMVTNTVSVTSITPDPIPTNNSASLTNTISNPPPSLGAPSASSPISGGFSSVNVTDGQCSWSAKSNVSWITVDFFSGFGNGFVQYTVAANPGPVRIGTITIAGLTFTVNQDGIPPNYIGYVDHFGCDSIAGWAADRTRLNTSINAEIYDGTTLISTVAASNSRPDVGAFLGDNGLHGFSIPTPAPLKDGLAHTVHVKFETSTTELSGSPVPLTCSVSGAPNYVGYLDHATCDTIVGWAADRSRPNTVIDIEVYDGTALIAIISAGNLRPDVGSFLGDNGVHGFVIATPAALRNGASHSVHIKFETSSTELTNSPATVNCTTFTPNYVGYVDHIACDSIGGWVADRNRPNGQITVSIYANDVLIATVPANASRPDVAAFLGDNGLHGFSIPTPANLKGGKTTTMNLRFETSAIDLFSNSPFTLTCP